MTKIHKHKNHQISVHRKGLTIIEMIVTIGIFLIGMQAFTVLVMRTWELNHYIMEEGEASFIASRATAQISEEIREANSSEAGHYPLSSGNDNSLTVYSDVDNDGITERIHYYLDANAKQLKRGLAKPAGNPAVYPAGDTTTTVMADYVVNTSTESVFIYYGSDYPADDDPLDTPVNPSLVHLIRINLFVNITPNRAPEDTNIESFAELRNINDYE